MDYLQDLLENLPAEWTLLEKFIYIDKGLSKELEIKLDELNLDRKRFDSVVESTTLISSEIIRTYFTYCSVLNLVYLRDIDTLHKKLLENSLEVGGVDKSLYFWLCTYDMLQLPHSKYHDKELLKLGKIALYYIEFVRPNLWNLIIES